jgi:DNA repair ATPase RecN
MADYFSPENKKFFQEFYEPKTVDSEYNMKIEQIKIRERNIKSLHSLLNKVPLFYHAIKEYYMTLSSIMKISYDSNSSDYFKQVSNIYKELLNLFKNYTNSVNVIATNIQDWLKDLDFVKKSIKEREKHRLIYDHYDDKMEKFVRKRKKHLEKNTKETTKFIETFERVSNIIFILN